MTARLLQKNHLFYLLLLGILTSVIFTSVFSYSVKQNLIHDFEGIKFIVDSDFDLESSLYFTYNDRFKGGVKLKNSGTGMDTLYFKFPSSARIVKKFRLDFGNNPKSNHFKILEMHLLFKDKTLVFDQDEVFNSLFKNSEAVEFDKKNQIISLKKDVKPFDPYIIIMPLAELSLKKSAYPVALFLPFIIIALIICKRDFRKIKLLDMLILLFIISIPLKIAWTTFCAFLLCVYGLVNAIRKKRIELKKPNLIMLMVMFCVLILFGRPLSFSFAEKLFALLVFALISATIQFPKYKIYRYYTIIMLGLNAIIVASAISFLIWFREFYAFDISEYFTNIKHYNSNIRKWFYYDHAAYLSLFGLIGVIFAHILYHKKTLTLPLLYLYHILLFLFIVLTGTRISLLIYVVFLFNMTISLNIKNRILINTLLYVVFTVMLGFYLPKIDSNRHHLWSVTWEAIKEKPWFGYGLGQSNSILHDAYFIHKAGYSAPLRFNHSHNQYLTFLLEIGAIGLSVLLIGIFYLLYKTKSYRNHSFVLFVFGLGYFFLTESVSQTSKPLYVICFLFLIITTKSHIKARE